MPLGMEVGLSAGDFVLDGDPASPPLKGHSPQFSSNVRCGQTTGWTKMALGMEVGLGPGDFLFDGDPAAPEQRAHSPPASFGHVCRGRTARWMKTPLGTEVRLGTPNSMWPGPRSTSVRPRPNLGPRPRPRSHCIRCGPSSARKGQGSPHLLGPCLLWSRSPISATAELLL